MRRYIFKISAIYLTALGIGIALYFLMRPYAMAHRFDPTRIGGEVVFPIAIPFLAFFARSVRNDIKSGLFSQEANEDE